MVTTYFYLSLSCVRNFQKVTEQPSYNMPLEKKTIGTLRSREMKLRHTYLWVIHFFFQVTIKETI